jgi:ATP-binding cassette, subfamily B, heavy metal transporter
MTQKNNKKEKNIDFKRNLKIYLEMAKKYRGLFLILVILTIVVESISILEKYLFKIVIDNGTDYISGSMIKSLFITSMIIIAIIFIIGLIIKVISQWLQIHFINKVDGGLMFDLKKKFFDHIVHLDHNFHTNHKTGSLIARITRGSKAIEGISDFIIFNVGPLIFQLLIIGFSLILFDWVSAVVIVSTAILFITYGVFMANKQKTAQAISNASEDIEKGNISDVFTNIDSIKYYGKEKIIKNRYAQLAKTTKLDMIKFWDYHRWFSSGQALILGLGTFFIVLFPLIRFLDGEITIGTLAFIYSVYLSIIGPLFGFVWGMRRFYISLGDFDSLFEYLEFKNEIKDKTYAKNLKIKKGSVEFDNISFKYIDKHNKAIDKFSLKIKPNEKIALVGHSGCGKTTLVKLLYRFHDIQSGSINIDNKNINEFKQESLRSELSIVPQEAVLFDDTIYNNIAFSRPAASRAEIIKAIKFAQLDKFINELPKKEQTIVGERGIKLSGGEKQRVSIARAILANRKILVLDEATSALDSKTEDEIQKDLEKLMKNRTSIIIAHRLSTIMKADRIIVMKKGKIVQIGKHNDLIKTKGHYQELWNLQKGGYIK